MQDPDIIEISGKELAGVKPDPEILRRIMFALSVDRETVTIMAAGRVDIEIDHVPALIEALMKGYPHVCWQAHI